MRNGFEDVTYDSEWLRFLLDALSKPSRSPIALAKGEQGEVRGLLNIARNGIEQDKQDDIDGNLSYVDCVRALAE
ncbi:hypothetical protein K0M31_008416 [Melipona bicolor]|uniref:Uncharacterized protein n=1 Tax=Melipona bicolor TaxID=60889 RepID=A0AA40FRN0_9HYME|nr:hypothetical protein K0M31_008416 [Melipona bicolor]